MAGLDPKCGPSSLLVISSFLIFIVLVGSPLAGVVHTSFPVEYENHSATLSLSTTGYCVNFVDINGVHSNTLTCQAAAVTYTLEKILADQIRLAGFTHIFMGSYGVLLVSIMSLFLIILDLPKVSVGFSAFGALSTSLLVVLEVVFALKGRNQPLEFQNIGPAISVTIVVAVLLFLSTLLGWKTIPKLSEDEKRERKKQRQAREDQKKKKKEKEKSRRDKEKSKRDSFSTIASDV